MPNYSYQARQKTNGRLVRGQLEAKSQTEAIKELRTRGLLVTKLTAQGRSRIGGFNLLNRIQTKDRVIFARQLAVMIKAGLPILPALRAIHDQTENPRLKETIIKMARQIEGGASLSASFKRYESVFPPLFASVAKVGEKSGQLDQVLTDLADQLESDAEIVSKTKGAMIYPAIVLTALIGVMILITVFIIPQLLTVFEDAEASLPVSTKAILAISNFIRAYGVYVLVSVIALTVFIRYQLHRSLSWRLNRDRLLLKLPVFGSFIRKVSLTRFLGIMSTLLKAGLPMIEAIRTSSETVNNEVFSRELMKIAKRVEAGESFSTALQSSKEFPPMIGQMAAIGETGGAVEDSLQTVAGFYQKDLANQTRNLSTAIEPILMIVMALGVGLIVSSVMTPIYNLISTQ
ncbi:MAG: putative Type IV pilus assembly protein PilC [Candidatus Berkelbacteria bacterium Gr01-1014_85]|uniref:Putative Type IV pilus assembly protein PilC n=1 Tax=Candidatus Berkelbacteria bacterium Gr01-1014_85 TaxID=2017150 RepID=A0A554JAW9_9BACT|nr:MAG: putative Type IV pilus assembly protein PilC [Candidatus Berkelbacteria bacterium Gr01-1014_85]